jgi:hypothetical protein
MKILIKYLKNFLKEDFRVATYLPVFVYLGCLIGINYSLEFENKVLDHYVNTFKGFVFFFIFYAVGYFPVAVYVLLVNKKKDVLFKPWFWVKTVFIISVLAASAFFSFYSFVLRTFSTPDEKYFIRKILVNSRNVFMILFPLVFFWFVLRPYKSGFLWIRITNINLKPYLLILLIIAPLLLIASYSADFQHTYPTFKPWLINDSAFGLNNWVAGSIYEVFYGCDFITVEMIFRGALVIGLMNLLGKECILPMISVYCFLHFGKPMGEAISSIFGGYILGVIAYNTKSISGGIIVHMGVAWMMDFFAYLQHIL